MPSPVKRLSTQVVYDGHKVRLEVHDIEDASGRRAIREVVRHGGSVAVLALRRTVDAGTEVLLERNYRYTVDDYLLEIPAGTLDRPGEPPIDCARRELAEETGYRPAPGCDLTELLTLLPSPGMLTERLTVFIVDQVVPGPADREPGEIIEVLWTPWAEALAMIRDGRITDANTVAALLFWDRFAAAETQPSPHRG
jgi:ADP-ribose pyrophosphatase